MNTFLLRCGTALFCLFFMGCASTVQKTYLGVKESFLPVEIVAQIDEDLQKYLESPSDALGQSILQRYQNILKTTPEYVPALRGLYSFYYINTQILVDAPLTFPESRAGLIRVYSQLPPVIRREYFPPTFATYQRNMAIKEHRPEVISDRLLLNHLLVSAEESPQNATVRAVLAEHLITMGHASLAEAVLFEAASNDPKEELYPYTLANHFYQQALGQDCIQDESNDLRPALSLYRTVLKLNPDADVHYQVGIIYGLLGLTPLMLNEAAVLAKKGDLASLWQAAYLYIYSGNVTKAKEVFDIAGKLADLKTQPQGRTYIDYLMLTGQWQTAVEYYPDYLRAKYALGSYDVLLAGLMTDIAHREDNRITFDDAWPASNKLSHRHPWPVLLFDVMIGDKGYEKAMAGINGNEIDRCQLAQLNFYAAVSEKHAGNNESFKAHVEAVEALKLPFSLESLLSTSLLQ